MFNWFDDEATRAFREAEWNAKENATHYLDDVHLLIGCCRLRDSRAARVLLACGQDPVEVCARAEARAAGLPKGDPAGGHTPMTESAKNVLKLAAEEMKALGHAHMGAHHLLLALLRNEGELGEVLRHSGLQLAEARKAAVHAHKESEATSLAMGASHVATLRAARNVCVELQENDLAERLKALEARLESQS